MWAWRPTYPQCEKLTDPCNTFHRAAPGTTSDGQMDWSGRFLGFLARMLHFSTLAQLKCMKDWKTDANSSPHVMFEYFLWTQAGNWKPCHSSVSVPTSLAPCWHFRCAWGRNAFHLNQFGLICFFDFYLNPWLTWGLSVMAACLEGRSLLEDHPEFTVFLQPLI